MISRRAFPQRLTKRAFIILLVHFVSFIAAYASAFLLRFEFKWEKNEADFFFETLPSLLVIKLLIFYGMGQCHRSWRDATFGDMAALLRASTLSSLVFATYIVLGAYDTFPRTVLVMDWTATVLLLGGLRAISRLSREEFAPLISRGDCRRALIVGANLDGESLARQFRTDIRLHYQAIGFLDDDEGRHGSTLGGFPVLGSPDEVIQLSHLHSIDDILVISGALTGARLRQLIEDCQNIDLRLKIIPGADNLLSTDYPFQMRDVKIDDLLRRDQVQLNDDAIEALIAGRTVLVTGAGGSIGSEICRQVIRFKPAALILVERSENNLFLIEKEFRDRQIRTPVIACLADITDAPRIETVFAEYHPAVVFHAAAHKHVPMMEINPGEAIKNNILGTKLLAEISDEYGVDEFVMISTDKAVNPTSMMGASKHVAERFVHAFSESATTKFVAVRFGNVLASAGSVVPIFQEQIRHGGPITVTHPDITRFFMTIPEASQLVLQAAAMGKGGEIFVLDMGEPVSIVDLAKDLIRLSGLFEEDIEIVFTGLRPGEKLYEELYFDEEEMLPTPHSKLFVAYHRPCKIEDVRRQIAGLAEIAGESREVIRAAVKQCVPEYTPFDPPVVGTESPSPEVVDEAPVDGASIPQTAESKLP